MKKIITFLLLFIFVPFVHATDTRIEVSHVELTSNMVAPVYGASIPEEYDFETVVGEPAYTPGYMGAWFKKNGGEWERLYGGVFTEGTYFYMNQIRIDGEAGYTHKLTNDTTLTVDGVAWTPYDPALNIGEDYSYRYYQTAEITVTKTEDYPLTFGDSDSYNITSNFVGVPITQVSLSEAVVGGVGTYTFTKVSGPDWINVSTNGIISGTPTEETSYYAYLVVRVTDGASNYKEITIDVAPTYPDPSKRYVMLYVDLVSDMGIPVYGGKIKDTYNFTAVRGEDAYMPGYMGGWFKKASDGSFYKYEESTFTEGTYYYINQIRVDGLSGLDHVLDNDTQLTVDGVKWKPYEPVNIDNDYSYRYYQSPNYVVVSSKKVIQTAASTTSVTLKWNKTTGAKGYYVQEKVGSKWKTVKTITKPNTTSVKITKLKAGTKHTYRVQSYKIVKSKKNVFFTTNSYNALTTPTNPQVSLSIRSTDSMNIKFTGAKGASKYVLEKSLDGNSYSSLYFGKASTQYDSGHALGNIYYYRVKACNANNFCSSWVVKSKKQTTKVPGFTLSTKSKKVTIKVNEVADAEGYEVYRSTKEKTGYKKIATITDLSNLKLVDNTSKGKVYYYKVRSYKEVSGNNIYSDFSKYKKIKSK